MCAIFLCMAGCGGADKGIPVVLFPKRIHSSINKLAKSQTVKKASIRLNKELIKMLKSYTTHQVCLSTVAQQNKILFYFILT
jgi:hypothetical protein